MVSDNRNDTFSHLNVLSFIRIGLYSVFILITIINIIILLLYMTMKTKTCVAGAKLNDDASLIYANI